MQSERGARRTARQVPIGALFVALALCAGANADADEPAFEILTLASPGRTQTADLVDLDGDGRTDLLSIAYAGLPPDEKREIRIHYQAADGTFSDAPDWTAPVPADAATYDIGDLPDGPGVEVLWLRRRGLTVLSFAGRQPRERDIPIPGALTLAPEPDERGLGRLHMSREEFGADPILLVPTFDGCVVFTPSGEELGRPDVGARANYFLPRRHGPVIAESEIEIYYDVPRFESGDVDGDGRVDLIAVNRHEVRVFRRREDGRFPTPPDLRLPVRLISEPDHIRGSGSVRASTGDFNLDGRVDLLLSHTAGTLRDPDSDTLLFLNRGGSWDLTSPDQIFHAEGAFTTYWLVDIDFDGRDELIQVRVPLGVLEIVEVLITREVDAEVTIRRASAAAVFEEEPWVEYKQGVPYDFEMLRPRGFLPSFDADLNADGFRDLVTGGGGKALEVYLGGTGKSFRKRVSRQELDTTGRLRFGDVDGNGLPDLLIFDTRRPGHPIQIAVNRGILPGTPIRPILVPADDTEVSGPR